MHKVKSFWTRNLQKISNWSLTKKILYGALLLLAIFLIYKIFGPQDPSAGATTALAERGALRQTVLATGQVTSTTDLSLSFYKSGTVKSLRARVGEKVSAGTVLAALDQGTEAAALTSAKGALAAAKAKYQKVIEGTSETEISLAEVALQNAQNDYAQVKAKQDLLVEAAKKAFDAYPTSTNDDSYKLALKTKDLELGAAQATIDQRRAELAVKKSSATPADIQLAKADILSAEGTLQSAEANLEHTVLRAPAMGTVTKVNIKLGETAQAGSEAIILQDVGNLYIEAYINEANIVNLKIGQSVDITFDAFGKDKKFTGTVAHIDPSAETNDGVVNYKIKVSIKEDDKTIRPGMNANIQVLAGQVADALLIPYASITKKDGKNFVKVVTNPKKWSIEEKEVSMGFIGDSNLVEILSGLSAGDTVIVSQK